MSASNTRPTAVWRATLRGYIVRRGEVLGGSITEILDVEAPEGDIYAAGNAALRKLRTLRHDMSVVRVDVFQLDDRTPPSALAQQESLWNAQVTE